MRDGEDALCRSLFRVGYSPPCEADEAAAMRQFRAALDVWAVERKGGEELIRANAIALLKAIVRAAGPALRVKDGELDTGESILLDHPATAELMNLIGALSDLDNGKTPQALLKYSEGATASLFSHEARRRDSLLELVDVLAHDSPGVPRRTIEAQVSRWLKNKGTTRRGAPISARWLRDLRNKKA